MSAFICLNSSAAAFEQELAAQFKPRRVDLFQLGYGFTLTAEVHVYL